MIEDGSDVRHRQALSRAASERWFNRQTNYPYFIYMVILLILAIAIVQLGLWLGSYDQQERRMLISCCAIRDKLGDFAQENFCLPERLSELPGYMDPAEDWPVSPWSGQPVRESDSPSFDPRLSPGTVCYRAVRRDGHIAAWELFVFGSDRLLFSYRGVLNAEQD